MSSKPEWGCAHRRNQVSSEGEQILEGTAARGAETCIIKMPVVTPFLVVNVVTGSTNRGDELAIDLDYPCNGSCRLRLLNSIYMQKWGN